MSPWREALRTLWSRLGLGAGELPDRPDRPIEEVRFVVLDAELTGLDPNADELLSVGAIRMIGSRILVGETFYRTVRPARETWDATVAIHRILPSDVEASPPADAVLEELAQFCAGAALVGYYVGIDRQFLEQVGRPREPAGLSPLWLDVRLAGLWLAHSSGSFARTPAPEDVVSLEALAQCYGISVPQVHHALVDAFVTAQIWQRQLAALRAYGVKRLRNLARVARA